MAENKTKKTDLSVDEFIDAVESETKREDARQIVSLMHEITGDEPKMWGPSIIGFGDLRYVYENGREGDWFKVGFSPRKTNLTLYIMPGFSEYGDLLDTLGKYKTGKSCLYIKRLSDIDEDVLTELIQKSVDHITQKYAE